MPSISRTGQNLTLNPTKTARTQHESFQKVIKNLQLTVKHAAPYVMKTMARRIHGRLVSRSPIVSGSYVLSHQIGMHGKNSEVVTVDSPTGSAGERIPHPNRRGIASQATNRAQRIIGNAKGFSRIIISNSIHYAINVEYLGWLSPDGKKATPPYFVYTQTDLDMKSEMPEIIKDAESKLKAILADKKAMQNAEAAFMKHLEDIEDKKIESVKLQKARGIGESERDKRPSGSPYDEVRTGGLKRVPIAGSKRKIKLP